MEDIEKIIAQTKAEIDADDKLQRCSFCVWHDECTKKSYYAPHCKEYLTNEQALRVLAIQEREKAQKELARIQLKMDIMSYLINGAMAEMEDIDAELEESYERLRNKDAECERNHAECKRNRKRLIDAYKRMKYSMKNIDLDYHNYVEHYFSTIFGEEDGTYNVQEYDKSSVNSGMVRAFVTRFIDISLENGENCQALFDFMNEKPGCGLFKERDFTKCLIRK
jgi:hypothetical protein